ncbi:hypothetical protein D1007_00548 [Hordeum vulgare]|nr:hypothetical protein D1007_00548 [Hordeum vulgare]
MGPATTSAGVTFREGPFTASGERVAHGLVVRYGAFDRVNDNAHRLEDADFPMNGSIISFGSSRVYVVVVAECYPADVANDDALPPTGNSSISSNVDDLCHHVEVLTTNRRQGRPPIGPRSVRRWSRSVPLCRRWPTPRSPPKSSTTTVSTYSARRRHWRRPSATSRMDDASSALPAASRRLTPTPAG